MGSINERGCIERPRTMHIVALLALLPIAAAWAADPARELRVCADPSNLPFSNDRLEGFENKIAQVIANDLNASVRYTWLSQRGGFIRKTLAVGQCDVLLTVPSKLDLVLPTKPYYRSSYVFVYAKKKNLDLHSFDDPGLRGMRIGIHAFGEEGTSPASIALSSRGIIDNIVGFTIMDTDESPKGKIIDAVADGQIDVAIVWGPFGGYFAKREPVELEVVPVSSRAERTPVPFVFDISMGVRPGDTALKKELEDVLDRRHDEIQAILKDYGVPLLPGEVQPALSAGSPHPDDKKTDLTKPAI